MQNLAQKKSTFLQDILFISICFTINTSKCAILQKRKRLFCKIFHLLVLVNTQSCRKKNDFFCKIFHLLVYVPLLILVNAKSCKKENDFFARYPFISTRPSLSANRIASPIMACRITVCWAGAVLEKGLY